MNKSGSLLLLRAHFIVDRVLGGYFLHQPEINCIPTCASTPDLDQGRTPGTATVDQTTAVFPWSCADDLHRPGTSAMRRGRPLGRDPDRDLWRQPMDRGRKVRYRVGRHRVRASDRCSNTVTLMTSDTRYVCGNCQEKPLRPRIPPAPFLRSPQGGLPAHTRLALKLLAMTDGKRRLNSPVRERCQYLYQELWSVYIQRGTVGSRADRHVAEGLAKPRGLTSDPARRYPD